LANKTVIGFTCGDINGIGPEVLIKALKHKDISRNVIPLLIGPASIFHHLAEALSWNVPMKVIRDAGEVVAQGNAAFVFEPMCEPPHEWDRGEFSAEAGRIAGLAMEAGVRFAREGHVAALVTAPLSKRVLNQAGYEYPGMTEFCADRTGAERYAMMLIASGMRIALVTTHTALSRVAGQLSVEQVLEKIEIVHGDLQSRFGIPEPRIAVCALNPHCGDGGLFGREELDIIDPAINVARSRGIDASGAYSADALFARYKIDTYDAYLAMYHDQGLIPIKVLHFGRAVNYTAGLPIIRTSPDHGTAFDIAGKGVANESSMLEAIRLAYQLAQKEAPVAG
jgi:4-hydroxythreonine-4-phosphate dehydrogenase